eukprot:g1427.t1
MRTLSAEPPVFSIDNFLSAAECARVLSVANNTAGVMSDSAQSWRRSRHGWLALTGALGARLRARASSVARLPPEILMGSESMQVVHYGVGGHYHAHHDSDGTHTSRYATLLVFLTDVGGGGGGETAFPRAVPLARAVERGECAPAAGAESVLDENFELRYNLSQRAVCTQGVAVPPRAGRAVLFYNHLQANATHLGPVDVRAVHGGCDVLPRAARDKWIANIWWNVPSAADFLDKKRQRVAAGDGGARDALEELGAAFAHMQTLGYEEQVRFAEEFRQRLEQQQ